MLDEHVYYWAWAEEDNKDCDFRKPKWFRVFRSAATGKLFQRIHDDPITEAMSKAEAIEYCQRIVKLTGGREL
jgi:hypothetical protein